MVSLFQIKSIQHKRHCHSLPIIECTKAEKRGSDGGRNASILSRLVIFHICSIVDDDDDSKNEADTHHQYFVSLMEFKEEEKTETRKIKHLCSFSSFYLFYFFFKLIFFFIRCSLLNTVRRDK